MQDALPAFVLHSEANRRSIMNDASKDSEQKAPRPRKPASISKAMKC